MRKFRKLISTGISFSKYILSKQIQSSRLTFIKSNFKTTDVVPQCHFLCIIEANIYQGRIQRGGPGGPDPPPFFFLYKKKFFFKN
jgi:hypothetical protein